MRDLTCPLQGHLACFSPCVFTDCAPGKLRREGGLLPHPVLCLPQLCPGACHEPGIAAGLGVLGWRIGALSVLEEAALRVQSWNLMERLRLGVGDAGMIPLPSTVL